MKSKRTPRLFVRKCTDTKPTAESQPPQPDILHLLQSMQTELNALHKQQDVLLANQLVLKTSVEKATENAKQMDEGSSLLSFCSLS